MTANVTASAPGSIMLTGEHAVVYGHPAIVAAIDQRITVSLTPIAEPVLTVSSPIADTLTTPMAELPTTGPYRFVGAAVTMFAAQIKAGLEVTISSDIDPTLGLGSSAAVTVATLGALAHLAGDAGCDLHTSALTIVRSQQGRGSGADLAASLTGGCVSYQLPDAMVSEIPTGTRAIVNRLPDPPALSLRYTGYKTPTGEVLAQVAANRIGREAEVDAIYHQMGAKAAATIVAAQTGDWTRVGSLMGDYQHLMAQLGVSDATIEGIIAEAADTAGLLGCKISGSGLGDCVLALGSTPAGFTPAPLANKGLIIHDDPR